MKYVQLQVTVAKTSQFHFRRRLSARNPPCRAPVAGEIGEADLILNLKALIRAVTKISKSRYNLS